MESGTSEDGQASRHQSGAPPDDLLEGEVATFSSDELRAMAQKAGVRRYE
jgi:hypothetical protein